MREIESNDFKLNISRYVSIAEDGVEIELKATHRQLLDIDRTIRESTAKHNGYLKELGLQPLP